MNLTTAGSHRLVIALSLLTFAQIAFAQFIWMDDKGVRQYSDRPPPPSVPRSRIIKSPVIAAPLAVTEPAPTVSSDNAKAVATSASGSASTSASAAASGSGLASASSASSTAATTASKNSAPMTTAERNAEYTKRKMDEAEKEKKSAEAAKLSADKKVNCDRAQSYSRGLESGGRISTTDKNGERAYLSDDQRAQELRNAQRLLSGCK